MTSHQSGSRHSRPLATAAFLLSVPSWLLANPTQLADTPLADTTTVSVLPNIALMLDDSGSMDDENMPNDDGTNKAKNCWKWHKYNTLFYDPTRTYKPPLLSDGVTRYPDADFVTALKDGYFAKGAKMYDGTTNNTEVNLNGLAAYYSTHKTNPNSTTCDADNKYDVVINKANIAAPGTAAGSPAALTNYANWYSYYRKRAYVAKAGVGEAFAKLESGKYRVGYFTINSIESGAGNKNHDLTIDSFKDAQRQTWFDRLYGTHKDSGTPLRGALSRMGQMYAGKINGWDPVQYSCQRNYTIMATDGYWNVLDETASYGPFKMDGTTQVGDQDGVAGVTRPELDDNKAANTLADVAYYYYHTDLRPGNCATCTDDVPPNGNKQNVDDVATHQHMTTYTIGLGVNGTLKYVPDYKTSTDSGANDYYNILQGKAVKWPNPVDGKGNDNLERIDDLWHAAVNGRGTYFSAGNSETLTKGLAEALGGIASATGSGAAAATSNLQPTSDEEGSDRIYIANYTTSYWYGDISAYQIDLNTGKINALPLWQAGPLLNARNPDPAANDRTVYFGYNAARKSFQWSNLSAAEKAYFNNNQLSQYANWTPAEQATTGEELVNYLRGLRTKEDPDGSSGLHLYRNRQNILGDIVHAQPVFVKKSFYNFGAGYDPTHGGRRGILYAAANDGMLHAFCTEMTGSCTKEGQELWAYVIPPIMKDMWYLADKEYKNYHHYLVDGPLAVSDIESGGWKTIIVGGLGKGGRGYYAVDVTDPTNPRMLWTFTANDEPNLGYSYGMPMITKVDGQWVVLIASGYNNVPNFPKAGDYPSSNGGGYLFMLNAATGALIKSIPTGVGSAGSPSGLAKLNIHVTDFETDNTALAAFGGDLEGNMWRFDLTAGTAKRVINTGRPITAAPEIGEIDGKQILYFGTGRYLGQDDLTDGTQQAIYGVRADSENLSTNNLVEQTGSVDIDWGTDKGWYLKLTGGGERIYLDAQLFFETLIFASTLPTASECRPGGTGRLYFINYRDGKNINGNALYTEYASPIVGFSVAKLPGGTPKVYPITADGGFPKGDPPTLPMGVASGAGSGTRIIWRELLN